jgi:hypothetical protein
MKLVNEHINEFEQGKDPYKTMGLGLWTNKDWIPKVEAMIFGIYEKEIKFFDPHYDDGRLMATIGFDWEYNDDNDDDDYEIWIDLFFEKKTQTWTIETCGDEIFKGEAGDFPSLVKSIKNIYNNRNGDGI